MRSSVQAATYLAHRSHSANTHTLKVSQRQSMRDFTIEGRAAGQSSSIRLAPVQQVMSMGATVAPLANIVSGLNRVSGGGKQ